MMKLVLILALILAGCGGSDDAEDKQTGGEPDCKITNACK